MDIQKERELFLAHMRSIGSAGFMFELDDDGNFDDMSMAYAWSAWQEAKAQANKQFENFIDQAIEDSACADERRSLQTLLEDFQEQTND